MFRKLDETMLVAPQIAAADIGAAAAQGIRLIVNNRPEGEEAGQPWGGEIEAAAREAGIGYCAIPVGHGGFSHAQVDAMAGAIDGADGPVLAYCRSGTRSTYLWALARAKLGDPPDALAAKAAGAGYDLTPIRPMLEALVRA